MGPAGRSITFLVRRKKGAWGFLLRGDVHKRFGEGYLIIGPEDLCITVSKQFKEELENRKDYYKLEGQVLRKPCRFYLAFELTNKWGDPKRNTGNAALWFVVGPTLPGRHAQSEIPRLITV
jgi:hypothetical protein